MCDRTCKIKIQSPNIRSYFLYGGISMYRGLVIFNIVLTLLLIAGLAWVFRLESNFESLTEEKISVLSESLREMNEVMNEHAQVLSEHAKILNQHTKLMDERYLAAIEENQADMAEVISKYQQLVDESASYMEKMHRRLEDLSLVIIR